MDAQKGDRVGGDSIRGINLGWELIETIDLFIGSWRYFDIDES
jgi:hypothetical protein